MCRICQEDDGHIICTPCYEDPQIQGAINFHQKKSHKRIITISLTPQEYKQLKKKGEIQKQLFLHKAILKYKKTTRGRKSKEN